MTTHIRPNGAYLREDSSQSKDSRISVHRSGTFTRSSDFCSDAIFPPPLSYPGELRTTILAAHPTHLKLFFFPGIREQLLADNRDQVVVVQAERESLPSQSARSGSWHQNNWGCGNCRLRDCTRSSDQRVQSNLPGMWSSIFLFFV